MDNASSADLQWLLLRKWNSKMVSRGGITFSREAGNLKNYHSYRYSGLAQPKPLSITAAPKGGVRYTTKKDGANPRHLTSARKTVRARGACIAPRKAAGKAAKIANSYRPDLLKAAVIRAARVAETTRKTPKSA